MTHDELEVKRFELEQKVQLDELELKKKELDLKIQEQKSKRIYTPLVISIVGGLFTIITGLTLNYFDNQASLQLEDKKFQSSLLLKITDAKSYDDFSNMLTALQYNGLLPLDSAKIANLKKAKLVSEQLAEDTKEKPDNRQSYTPLEDINSENFLWTIVGGGDANLDGARYEKSRALKNGFNYVDIWYNKNSFRTCIGKYSSYLDAVNDLYKVKKQVNSTSYVVRLDEWCRNSIYDSTRGIYVCK